MQVPVIGPTNRFLIAQRDRRWPRALTAALLTAGVVALVLLTVGWPRLESTSVHYDLLALRAEVRQLEARERQLRLELEQVRAPARLGRRAAGLGLAPPPVVAAEEAP